MENQKCYRINRADIIYENFEDEMVLINLKTGIYYSMNDTAMIIWEYIKKEKYLDEIILGFLGKHGADSAVIEDEIKRFTGELEKEGLIFPSDTNDHEKKVIASDNNSLDAPTDGAFIPPIFKKYTDQQELLLMDPIHDVSDLGWPDKNR